MSETLLWHIVYAFGNCLFGLWGWCSSFIIWCLLFFPGSGSKTCIRLYARRISEILFAVATVAAQISDSYIALSWLR